MLRLIKFRLKNILLTAPAWILADLNFCRASGSIIPTSKSGYLMDFKFAERSKSKKSKLYRGFVLALDIGFEFAADLWVL